jgi:hypothetical protein
MGIGINAREECKAAKEEGKKRGEPKWRKPVFDVRLDSPGGAIWY